MTTAAMANSSNNNNGGGDELAPPSSTNPPRESENIDQLKKTAALVGGLAGDASRAIGQLLPTATLQQMTTRKYTLPDKTVASQVLMYRQLLHTKCRPGLKLSRDFQGTPAQTAVMHMPWWEQGIEESKKMIISYDNLITRLWLNGAIEPWNQDGSMSILTPAVAAAPMVDLLGGDDPPKPEEGSESATPAATPTSSSSSSSSGDVETFITEEGLPPIPHTFWVDRLGFQQPDPVTDFRSGGVLSLAMMVYMVESQPEICHRFFLGDASVLPFGITCINVTDMISKFLMLAKNTDRMDALLSQKPFWRMFGDPNAILAVQELAMTMLADVVVELGQERQIPSLAKEHSAHHGDQPAETKVTVFDFSTILERTERRVRDDLLGAGPKTVVELRSIAGRLRLKYQSQLEKKLQKARQQHAKGAAAGEGAAAEVGGDGGGPPPIKEVMDKANQFAGAAGSFFAKMKTKGEENFAKLNQSYKNSKNTTNTPVAADASSEPHATIVDLPPLHSPLAPAPPTSSGDNNNNNNTTTTNEPTPSGGSETEGDWAGTDIASATDAISNFSIGDEDDEIL